MRLARTLLALTLGAGLAPTLAGAATHVVDVDGTYDAGANACAGTDPAFTTIQAAVTAAANGGDTILVCPGTYAEAQIVIDKGLTVQSVAGAATTIIDGTGGTGLAIAGTVRIIAATGDVRFDGFTVQNAKAGPSNVKFNVRVGSTATVTITVVNNVLVGLDNPADTSDYGLYAAGPNANDTLVFQHNTLRRHSANPILIERHKGPTDVSYNDFDRGVRSATTSAYVNMSHTNDAVTTLQKVSHNTIDLGNDPGPYDASTASSGVSFIGALTGTTLGTFGNVEISHNTFVNVRGFRRAIQLSNSANTVAIQANGAISNALIACNTISGPGEAGSVGVRLFGYTPNPTLSNNAITGVDVGLAAEPRNGHVVDTATAEENAFETGTRAVDWQSTGALAAERNWWGAASGPTDAGNPGGTGGVIAATGPVDYVPWLGTGADADAGPCFVPGGLDQCNGVQTCTAPATCSAPPLADGTACDDGDACSTGDVCTGGVCAGPGTTCGDGVVDAACGEVCDDGAGNGTNLCCSATCTVVDTDGDTLCDRDDPCTNGALATKQRLTAVKITAPAGNDKLSLKGQAVLVPPPPLDLVADGVRVLVVAANGGSVVDATIAGGAYDAGTRTGWRVNGAATSWTWKGPGTATAGITKVGVKLKPSAPGFVKFKVGGRNGTYTVTAPELPVTGILVLDPPAASGGQCIEARFPAPPPAKPSCTLQSGGATLKCK
ncbi:MAG: hypothetical protein KIT14_07155 [bacterium]|nr:hypothetical protein [bacterium]